MKQYLFKIIILFYMTAGNAATFCVTTSTEFQTALSIADSNGESDHIKLAEGNYETSNAIPGFYYFGNENMDLEISGGWTLFFNNPCGQILSGNPFHTTISGRNLNRVLLLVVGSETELRVSNILFVNGFSEDRSGAGILTYAENGYENGQIYIENNAFINNSAPTGSAFSTKDLEIVGPNNLIVMKNNLFSLNKSISVNFTSTIAIAQNGAKGTYFTNNTLVSNSSPTLGFSGTSGLSLDISGTSQALIANNIFYNDSRSEFYLTGNGTMYLYNNNIVGSITGRSVNVESGNIHSIPVFEDGIFNFMPTINSQVVGHGRKNGPFIPIPTPFYLNWTLGEFDNEGNIREQGDKVDIGAFETPHQSWQEIPIFKDGFE